MQKSNGDHVQAEADASHDEDQLHVADVVHRDEALDGLQENADAERQQEGPVEEGAEQPGTLPPEGEVRRKLGLVRDLPADGSQCESKFERGE